MQTRRRIVLRGAFTVTAAMAVAGLCAAPAKADPAIASLSADFAAFRSTIDAELGIDIAPVGGAGQPIALGEWRTGPAWSTIKVPLTLAALRAPGSRGVGPDIVAAITRSDNASADMIWSGLGHPVLAAAQVTAVLRESGDASTVVAWVRNRPPFSAFGQTQWSLFDQTRFLARAACDSRNSPVLALMGQIVPDQRWGVGTIPGVRFKGGWGPSPGGAYLLRQIAVVPGVRGDTVVAMATTPASGTFEDGVAVLDRVAHWLTDHRTSLPAGSCPPS
jgi:hypothetical protein